MGEIGIMVSRLQHEGFDLEDVIDEELRAAGFLELCQRTTRSLFQRVGAIEESQSSLRILLNSIDQQLKDYQENLQTPSPVAKDDSEIAVATEEQIEKQEPKKATVIVIDDDEVEFVDVADMSCQATFEEIRIETSIQINKEKENAQNISVVDKTVMQTQTLQPNTSKSTVAIKSSAPVAVSAGHQNTSQTTVASKSLSTVSRGSDTAQTSLSTMQRSSEEIASNSTCVTSRPSDIVLSVSSVTTSTTTPPVIYRTLKSPVISGAPMLPQRVALKSSLASLPVQQSFTGVKPSLGSVMSVASPTEFRESTIPSSQTHSANPSSLLGHSSSENKLISEQGKSLIPGAPNFEVGTRVIGQRADELWYPGVIEKILTDRSLQKKTKYKVKFDKGARGLLLSNHIALESYPHPSFLNVGSRVVALRPRDTAEENASWRKSSTGIYGKLDVLYAGIIAENACTENKNRFLVFFDDGFAQYLPVKKLHHVYHTGKKVWDEVAEHSKEFIQEYLEEFPNRPMVKLRVGQWVKTEWRGQWLKARVMQLDCSLVKMLFQIDNRSEWLYRGSTRLEPLYSALVNGKISTARRKRSRKLTRGKTTEPFIDYSITKPCLGISPYSKTDPKGEEQHKLEEKRQQTQLEQQRQQEHQEQIRDENKKMSVSTVSTKTATTTRGPVVSTTSAVTTASSTVASATGNVITSSKGVTEASTPSSQSAESSGKMNEGQGGENGSGRKAPGAIQSSAFKASESNSKTGCEDGHCVIPLSGPTGPQGKQSFSGVDKCGNGCNGCDSCGNSSLSAIQASNARKKTNAGLVNPRDRLQRSNGIEVIDLDGDSTAAQLSVSLESDQIIDSLRSRKSEYLTSNQDGSILDDLYNAWEAPWLRTNRRDVRSTGSARIPAFQMPANKGQKQDAAALIEERLKQSQEKSLGESESPGYSVVSSKPSIKGPHKCNKLCNSNLSISKEESVRHNPRAIPLLHKWKREIAQRHPGNKKTVYYRTPCNKRLRSFPELANYFAITETTNVSIDQFCFDPDISCQDTVYRDVEPICPDISRGAENVQISVVNEVDTCFPPLIDYVSKRILAEGVNMVLDPGFLACCDCTDNCQDKSKCSCAQLTIQASASVGGKEDSSVGYEFRMLNECVQTGIYECNQNCACGTQCFNRVVQNGIQLRLQVFKTENRGWGLRSLDDIPMGTFVCTYAGQILNEDMANKEGRDFGDEYLAELDHIEVVEKAKEGYESNVSDLEEDDSVIYRTLGGDSTSTATASENSDESSLSEDELSEADSLLSDGSISSGKKSGPGDGNNTDHKPSRRKKRKRSSKKSEKRAGVVQGEDALMVEGESKEKWCYIALKRNHDDQNEAAAFLKKMANVDSVVKITELNSAEEAKREIDEEEKNVSQSSEFDFDEMDESFWRNMQVNAMQSGSGNNATRKAEEGSEISKQSIDNNTEEDDKNIIDLTSEPEAETSEGEVGRRQPASKAKETSLMKINAESDTSHELFQPNEIPRKPVKKEANLNSDSAPSLLSADDLSKLAAQNPTVSDEPPVLTKMSSSSRVSNSLEDMISRLKTRVLTSQPSSSGSGLDEADRPGQVDFEQSVGDVRDNGSIDQSSVNVENTLGLSVEPISDPSSPDTENIESFPPSPSSLRSDVSKTESLDRKSEVSTGSSRRSTGVSSKPPAKKFKTCKPKIHYSRSHPKPFSTSPSIKAPPNTPSPSRPLLSRQSSASGKRMSTRLMFGEEHCYVIDANAYGNCGRYLNHSCSPNLFVQNVFVDTHDLRFPWVAFFTQQNVSAGTELTWDYAYEVDSVKGKVLHCYCGSAECRGRLL
ncbi:histone-lysine N-methyltransferase SETDB1-like isoform X1 [Montipora foliosa]|uniref:histone-lysine N-methyltransferase SETDB1-like isoform X1 n=1 Tax=Montipora foliosa TaxID=591990 RepID=UPI0035F1BA33